MTLSYDNFTEEFAEKFAVIGAGPKGISLAVKAHVLREFGVNVPEVILIERNAVAANWTGDFGYTNGQMKLGTSPEKDVVFPIDCKIGDQKMQNEIRCRLMQFGWMAYLIDTNQYSEWIDRGKPSPCHIRWSQYLRWVLKKLGDDLKVIIGDVEEIGLSEDKKSWILKVVPKDQSISAEQLTQKIEIQHLMMTGPGKTRSDFENLVDDSSEIYDLEIFWQRVRTKAFRPKRRIAIVGSGENAASILLALDQYDNECLGESSIEVISVRGFVSTRAENVYENRFYSNPDAAGWSQLHLEDRKDFVQRTDLGVFSVEAMTLLNDQRIHKVVAGRVKKISNASKLHGRGYTLTLDYHGEQSEHYYDQVILATGFTQAGLIKDLFNLDAYDAISAAVSEDSAHEELSDSALAQSIEYDLSVSHLSPKLYLPMCAGLKQGPGFANLSCLGLLSDRILLRNVL